MSPLSVDWLVGVFPVVCVLPLCSFMVWFVLCGCDGLVGGWWLGWWWLVKGRGLDLVGGFPFRVGVVLVSQM